MSQLGIPVKLPGLGFAQTELKLCSGAGARAQKCLSATGEWDQGVGTRGIVHDVGSLLLGRVPRRAQTQWPLGFICL